MTDIVAARGRSRAVRLRPTREAALVLALLVVGSAFAAASPAFLTASNLVQTLRAGVELAIVSAGMTLVIVMGGIDVSVGGIFAVSAILIGRSFQLGLPTAVVAAVGLSTGALLGAWNGFLCARLKLPPIIATLGSSYLFSAAMYLAIGGAWISGLPRTLSPLVNGSVGPIPAALVVIAAVYALLFVVLRTVPFGRHVQAIGCSPSAASLAGVDVTRVTIATYALLGSLAGFAALLYVARLRNVEINIGASLALESIAATILGGASIRGGSGSLTGTLLGVVFIRIVQNGLVLVGISSLWEPAIIGTLLLTVLVAEGLHGGRPARAT